MKPDCKRQRDVSERKRTYRHCCGECDECVEHARARGGLDSLGDTRAAALLALDDLARTASTREVVEHAQAYRMQDACRGGWHDSFNRALFDLAAPGLVKRTHSPSPGWRLTAAGRAVLISSGRQPNAQAPEPQGLF